MPASAHGAAPEAGEGLVPNCVDCHGAHYLVLSGNVEIPPFTKKDSKACTKCHQDDPEVVKQVGISAGFIASYEVSIHGIEVEAGNLTSASCSDCHGSHNIKESSDPSSMMSKWNIADTCSRCHFDIAEIFSESIHGAALRRGSAGAPTCTDCHGEHQIFPSSDPRSRVAPKNISEQVCATCHNAAQPNEKYGLAADRFTSFSDSYHGLASRAGSVEAATCASCHGSHNIRPSSDPLSAVHKDNLPATCGRCHPGANSSFARGAVHVSGRSDLQGTILNWIRTIYITLIVVIIGGMFLHNLLDFLKKTRYHLAVRRGEILPERYGKTQYIRMTLNERIQHALIFASFVILAVTGFMLRYPDSWWVVPIRQLSDRFFEVRSILHRIGGVAMIATGFYHLFYIYFMRRGKRLLSDIRPGWKDVVGAWKNLLFIAGLSRKKPRFDRFGYIEKIEYWALFWGMIVMAITGVVMWLNDFSMGHLTKLGLDIARTIHFYEACLATLAIFVWHFYFVIFNPSIYPMNTSWITGKISEEEMAEEHPLELARIHKPTADEC